MSQKPVVVFTTRHAFHGKCKDVLPMTSRSNVVYLYKCFCEQRYVGKTTQVLAERIKQHVPSKLSASRTIPCLTLATLICWLYFCLDIHLHRLPIFLYIYKKKKKEVLWVSGKYIKKNWHAAGLEPTTSAPSRTIVTDGLAVTICDNRAARR